MDFVTWQCRICGYLVSDETYKQARFDYTCRCVDAQLSDYKRNEKSKAKEGV